MVTDCTTYKQILEVAQIGWWEADFRQKEFTVSGFLSDLLGLDSDKISFSDLSHKIRMDYRDRMVAEFYKLESVNLYEEILPLHTRYGEKWLRSKLCSASRDEEGELHALGILQLMPDQYACESIAQARARGNEMLNHLGDLSRILHSFRRTQNLEDSVDKILHYLLHSFDGLVGHVFLMSIDYSTHTFTCDYETYSSGRQPKRPFWQHVPMDMCPWFIERLTHGLPVILHSPDDLPPQARSEREMLEEKQICSMMLIPLVDKEIVSGFIGLDTYCINRLWDRDDYLWLTSAANLISTFTDMAKTLDALEKDEELLRNLYDAIPIGIELYNEKGSLVNMNNKNLEIFGIQSKEIFPRVNLFKNPMLPPLMGQKIVAGEPVAFRQNYDFDRLKELYGTSRAGLADISTKISMLYDRKGKKTNYIVINIDNTEQTIVYNRLEEFEYFFSLISQFAGVGYARYDLCTLEGDALDQWYRNLGEQPGTPFREIVGFYKSVHPDDRQPFIDFIDDVKKGKVEHIQGDIRVRTGTEWKWIRTSLMKNPRSSASGKIDIICLNFDISEIKLNEEKKNRAEELERLKSAFIANITHDIKTPINAIVGFSTLLGEVDDPAERDNYIHIIRMNNELLLQLIANVLDLAKIESGMIQFNFTQVDLKELLYGLAASLRIKLSPSVSLMVEDDLPDCILRTDRMRLIQVLSNLANNAINYTTEGSVTMAYTLTPVEVRFTIADTGEGISRENQARIFDRFYKGHKKGTGLGLSICQGIVEQFGGQMGVVSELGKGSCFWFTHPRSKG